MQKEPTTSARFQIFHEKRVNHCNRAPNLQRSRWWGATSIAWHCVPLIMRQNMFPPYPPCSAMISMISTTPSEGTGTETRLKTCSVHIKHELLVKGTPASLHPSVLSKQAHKGRYGTNHGGQTWDEHAADWHRSVRDAIWRNIDKHL